MTTLRCDPVNPPLLGMRKVVSEDAVRRGFDKIEEDAGLLWLQEHLDYCTRPLLGEPWILDVDTTVKPLYGHQEGAVVSYRGIRRSHPQVPGPDRLVGGHDRDRFCRRQGQPRRRSVWGRAAKILDGSTIGPGSRKRSRLAIYSAATK
jgi:hypothetical protein